MKKWLLAPLLTVLMLGCAIYSNRPRTTTQPQSHPRPQQGKNWFPNDRFEKSCYNRGFRPGTESFRICIEKEQQVQWRQKERDEAVMQRKARQQETMRRKEEQQKAMEWKREQMKKKSYEKKIYEKKPYVKKPFK